MKSNKADGSYQSCQTTFSWGLLPDHLFMGIVCKRLCSKFNLETRQHFYNEFASQ
jgi:hypothetical protein